ncbi:kinase-like protein [Lophium mytilinum]|uniref:Kinase-like protein n=1 Tax=Lophium mytilinum TaxID=390894 RepID=A0A6A6QF95_9PEZI|nr:kinase-like protein [Lophium mytilinum]
MRQDFVDEAGNLQKLRSAPKPHPNILLNIGAVSIIDDSGFLVFDAAHCDLEDLLSCKCKFRGFQPSILLDNACGIAEALAWCHQDIQEVGAGERKVIHSDLKPKNILVFDESLSRHAWKITDFGISEIIHRAPDDTGTMRGQAPGVYQGPEVHPGGKINCSADMWSFGCILLEILAFARAGPGGIKELSDQRQLGEAGYEYRFCQISRGRAQLKPTLSKLLDDWNEEEVEWVNQWKQVALDLLKTRPEKRKTAQRTVNVLEDLIKMFNEHHWVDRCGWVPPHGDSFEIKKEITTTTPNYSRPLFHSLKIKKLRNKELSARISTHGKFAMFWGRDTVFAYGIDQTLGMSVKNTLTNFRATEKYRMPGAEVIDIEVAEPYCAILQKGQSANQFKVSLVNVSGNDIPKILPDGQTPRLSGSVAGRIQVSNNGDLLVRCHSQLAYLRKGGLEWNFILQDAQDVRAATFSRDGALIYAWSRSQDDNRRKMDHWYLWEVSDMTNYRECEEVFVSLHPLLTPYRG